MKTGKQSKTERVVLSFDYALKRLLRHKANHEILEGFLTELLKRPIKIKSILESETNQETSEDKQSRVDMLVKDETGELMIIEIQYTHEIDFFLRILFVSSKFVSESIKKGDDYENVKKVYCISIVYFNLGAGDDYIYKGKTDFRGIHSDKLLHLTEKQRKLFQKPEISDLYPEYYILNVKSFNDVATDTLDEWIYYLKNNTVKDNFTACGLNKVREMLDYDKLSPEEKRRYDKTIDRKLGIKSTIKTAKMEGEDEGRTKERREIVLNCFESGLSVQAISIATKIPEEEINNIINTK